MAESQGDYYYTSSNVNALASSLSSQRLSTFKSKTKTDSEAFELYLYNARLSKAFLFPLHILEVTLRNAIDRELSKDFGAAWHTNPAFQHILTKESKDSLARSVNRRTTFNKLTKHDVIADLSFDFWSNLFRQEYDRSLWQTRMTSLAPGMTAPTRAKLKPLISDINHFRNRIAHYEPIIGEDISKMHKQIVDLTSALSREIGLWVKIHSTVQNAIRTAPAASGRATASSMADKDFIRVEIDSKLSDLLRLNATFFIAQQEAKLFVCDHELISRYIASQVESEIIDFTEHTVEHVLKSSGNFNSVQSQANESKSSIAQKFKSSKASFVIVLRDTEIDGVIKKAHRRY